MIRVGAVDTAVRPTLGEMQLDRVASGELSAAANDGTTAVAYDTVAAVQRGLRSERCQTGRKRAQACALFRETALHRGIESLLEQREMRLPHANVRSRLVQMVAPLFQADRFMAQASFKCRTQAGRQVR